MVSTGRRYKTVYQTQSSPTDHRGSMTTMREVKLQKIRSVGPFSASLRDARAPFFAMKVSGTKNAKCEQENVRIHLCTRFIHPL